MTSKIGISILGVTGSIGQSTLDVVSLHSDKYEVVAISANRNVDKMISICQKHKPKLVAMADEQSALEFKDKIAKENLNCEVVSGVNGLCEVAVHKDAECVMAAIVGAAGLIPTYEAVKARKKVLLANKEALVMSGNIFIEEVYNTGAVLLPIDSEHNAIFQCLPEKSYSDINGCGVNNIWLTASGGPFFSKPDLDFSTVTPEQAVSHPNWSMGRKISVDSATMMNKGLEVIEASWLFNASYKDIKVVVHPQSIIHSMVSYNDGSVIAQMGNPDMRIPIANALAFPERIDSGVKQLDLYSMADLEFIEPDLDRFPCLSLAFDALMTGGSMPATLNAANEIAVESFLNNEISFDAIPKIISKAMKESAVVTFKSINEVMAHDKESRVIATDIKDAIMVSSSKTKKEARKEASNEKRCN